LKNPVYPLRFLQSILLPFLFAAFAAKGQDMPGIVTDSQSGINRAMINPAAVFANPWCFDVSLFTTSGGFQNNYYRTDLTTIRPLAIFGNQPSANLFQGDLFPEDPLPAGDYAYQHFRMNGPAFRFTFNQHSIGFISGIRNVSHIHNIPSNIVTFFVEGLSYPSLQDIVFSEPVPSAAASMGWTEVGLTYAVNLTHNGSSSDKIVAGITAKRLWGIQSVSIQADEITYGVHSDRNVQIDNVNASLQFALPLAQDQFQVTTEDLIKGRGMAFDLGMSWIKPPYQDIRPHSGRLYERNTPQPYDFMAGVSLLDLGAISWQQNTRTIEVQDAVLVYENPSLGDYNNLDEMVQDLQNRLINGSIENTSNEEYWLYLPTALSMQADYYAGRNVFLGLLLIQDLPLFQPRVARPSQLIFTPRYETSWFSVSAPVSFYRYRQLRPGLAFRLGFFTIGTNIANDLFTPSSISGFDLYFSFHWKIKNCRKNNWGGNPCFDSWR